MKKLRMLFLLGSTLLLGVAPLAAQNSVDVLGTGSPQPANTVGCTMNPNCIPATWSTTSNGGMDIATAITANFVFVPNGGALATDFPAATIGQICLADTRDLTGTTLFGQIATNCQLKGGRALLLIRDSAVTAPSTIPVFTISTTNGDFLRNTVGFNAGTKVSNFAIRINVAAAAAPSNPTGQHNCPNGQAVPAFVGPGTANYTPNESLCLPAGAGQAVEPSMTVDSQGTIYVESIRGVPGGLDLWRWDRALGPNTPDGGPNADGTLPFKYEGQPDCGIFPLNKFCTMAGVAPGGGDGDVAVNAPNPLNVPNLAVVSLSALEITGSHSTDRADTFSLPNPATAHIPFDDRMWIDGLDDPNHVYMEYHDFGTTSQIFVQRSIDGGQTYTDSLPSPVVSAALQPAVGPPTGNIAGQIKVDHSSCPSHGNLYQIFVGPDNATDNLQNSASFINAAYVGVASNVSLTSSTIPFNDYKIFSCGAGSTCPTGLGLGNLFPALAVDNFGYVYAAWSDNSNIYYSFSQHQGKSWSPAIKLTQNTPQAGKSNVFPWVAADANGHVAVAWYGADVAGDSNTVPAATTHWNVYVAETVNGHATAPAFTQSLATDHVNHTGQISTGGLLGSSDRSLADFFQIAIDPTNHLVNVAYADNHAGTSVTYFTRQKKATQGIVTTGACAGSCHQADGEGDEPGKNGGSAHFRIHENDCNRQGDSADFSDPNSGTDFHSTQVNSVAYDDVAHTMTIAGLGTNNGLPVVFTIVAADSSLVPPGLFSITLSNGYSNSGRLLGGSIKLY
ncbi:MAG TPA: hypothetical protein VOA64_04995 [Candidatus Dormibacteraeota bacterium]|nr:hypothetical protein [Candidatus Dormibacteraeota bacterium]